MKIFITILHLFIAGVILGLIPRIYYPNVPETNIVYAISAAFVLCAGMAFGFWAGGHT